MDTASSYTQRDEEGGSPTLLSPSTGNWQQTVSNTFSQLSMQFQAAAQAVASVPVANDQAIASLLDRLSAIEDGQRRLAQELAGLKEDFMVSKQVAPPPPQEANGAEITALQASLKELTDAAKLEQQRLPARLQNALALKAKSPIRMVPLKNGKIPPNSPATRGEFEHITKERYEELLKAYGVPATGDLANKRETLREFLGISSLDGGK
ncbi:hypothetical protein M422DRAFT_51728 [Sphaerobolus stellatus SS14]|uniref:Uncharacterized protein n=1 Tax=Sphaerobolus stellatus (strain SS14) TaxID=990650 RepID=A0A0C9UJD7_SPHS4|nr:hypothetical protein M422DRAFT_51728 [Sphaerobolus stellatus SS14]